MRRVRYFVATSLDSYIAGPDDEHDWIIMDPTFDFNDFFNGIDTVLLGRRTFERAMKQGGGGTMPGIQGYVFSRILRAEDYPDVIISGDAVATVSELRAEEGKKDIWLMGGGGLFRSLLDAGLVDTIELGVVPVLLGGGIPLLPSLPRRTRLELKNSRTYPSGIVSLQYDVCHSES
jgi:dihydrofolate reductase